MIDGSNIQVAARDRMNRYNQKKKEKRKIIIERSNNATVQTGGSINNRNRDTLQKDKGKKQKEGKKQKN